jgi:hypothetical protein
MTRFLLLNLGILLVHTTVLSQSRCLNINKSSQRNAQIYSSTGSKLVDDYLNQERKHLETIFAVKVKLLILDDSNEPNAYATSESSNPMSFDGTVYLGYKLLTQEFSESNGYAAVNGIMAHEYAHILQEKLNCTLQGAQRELHADFLAGYFMAKRGVYSSEEIAQFGYSMFRKGDEEVWDESHHGTPKQRLTSLTTGYLAAARIDTPKDAYYSGIALFDEDGGLKTEKEIVPIEATKDKNIVVTTPDGKKYTEITTVEYTIAGVTYYGLLLFSTNKQKAVLRLKFNQSFVQQDMDIVKEDGKIYVIGSNPIDPKNGTALTRYNPDIFYFVGEDMYITDKTGVYAAVTSNMLTSEKDINAWLKYLEW